MENVRQNQKQIAENPILILHERFTKITFFVVSLRVHLKH